MTHLHPGDEWLHDEHGQHVGCPTANGRDLERHERESRAHYAEHRERGDKPVDVYLDRLTAAATGSDALLNEDREVVVQLASGWSLRSGGEDYTSGDYVRLVTPEGTEHAYWDHAEWAREPQLVMGAIINSAAGLNVVLIDDDPEPSLWFAEGYSVGRYGTTRPVIHQLGAEDTAEFYRGLMRGTFTDPRHGAS